MTWIEIYLTVITITCLLINAINDIRTRYASLRVWLFQIISSLLGIILFQIIDGFSFVTLVTIVVNIILGFLIFALTLYLGLWGGGDSMGILALSFSVPYIFSYIDVPAKFSFFPPIIFLITNLIFGILLYAIYFLTVNIGLKFKGQSLFNETDGNVLNKISLMITSRQIPVNKIKIDMFYDPVEELSENSWRIKNKFLIPDLDDDELEKLEREERIKVKQDAEDTGRTYIWHKYQVPGIVAFLLGFIYWIVLGSPLVLYLEFIS